MPSSAALRLKIETDLQHRYPSALTPAPRTIRDVAPTGISSLDELLQGGFPVGAISELTGPVCSGRTNITLAFVANRTTDGNVCAWVDAADAFDPESAAANGISLRHLLWVRCADKSAARQAAKSHKTSAKQSQPWVRLDQAIRATDLLLQAGGFAAIVLDLADEEIEHARRIPLATWFRFRQAAHRTRSSLIVLGRTSFAQSSASLVLECRPGGMDESPNVIREFSYSVQRSRERFSPVTSITRKPPVSTWQSQSPWYMEKRA